MIVIYTGNGKGKTSATIGQVIRAHGRGLKVALGQFMKRDGQSGEQAILKQLLGNNFYAAGPGFLQNEEERPVHREKALALLRWSHAQLEKVQLLALDEALYALGYELITQKELLGLITTANERHIHLVLSGRGLPDWLSAESDLITEMKEIKHPFSRGGKAVSGIEF